MKYSVNYNFNKPDYNDQYDLRHWNQNTDKIDSLLKENETSIQAEATARDEAVQAEATARETAVQNESNTRQTALSTLLTNIQNGNVIAGKAKNDEDGNSIKTTYQKISYKKTSWSSTPSNDNYPSEKLVKDTIDSEATNRNDADTALGERIDNVVNGTTVVEKANKSDKDGDGNVIKTTYEKSNNKVSSWQGTPDDTHYPTEKLVKDTFDGLQNIYATKAQVPIKKMTADFIYEEGAGTTTLNEFEIGELRYVNMRVNLIYSGNRWLRLPLNGKYLVMGIFIGSINNINQSFTSEYYTAPNTSRRVNYDGNPIDGGNYIASGVSDSSGVNYSFFMILRVS